MISPRQLRPCNQIKSIPAPADIEALRVAYRAVMESATSKEPNQAPSAMSKPQPDNGLNAMDFSVLDEIAEPAPSIPFSLKSLKRPKLLISLVIGLCMLASAAYTGLAYWCLMSSVPSQAAEPVTMLNLSDEQEGHGTLENIRQLQKQTGGIIQPKEKDAEETTLLSEAGGLENYALISIAAPGKEATGRANPFEPLIQANDAMPVPKQERDLLDSVSFTGFVGDVNAKNKVAVIRINDPVAGSKTLIKRAGESFNIEGEHVILQGISKGAVQLKLRGASRQLPLHPYVELSDNGGSNTGTGTATPPGNTAAGSTGTADSATRSTNPSLMEAR